MSSIKAVFLNISQNLQENTYAGVKVVQRPAALLKRDSRTRVFL